MKADGNGGIASRILNFFTRWRLVSGQLHAYDILLLREKLLVAVGQ
jgi:hypothetical protein